MSRKNSREAKAKRRAENKVRRELNANNYDKKQIWVKGKDKYGKEKLIPTLMPNFRGRSRQ